VDSVLDFYAYSHEACAVSDEGSSFTVLSGWDVAFCHKIASQQLGQCFGVYFVGFDAGFSYGLCPHGIA
jgi:hypothetical protein